MTDDISNIETGASCYVLNNASTIYSYKGGIRKTYIQIGGKWFLSAQSNYYSVPDNAVCWSYNDLNSLSSSSEFLPIYMFIAFVLGVFVWFLCWYLFRRLFRWSVK